jgi:hypothetical protein
MFTITHGQRARTRFRALAVNACVGSIRYSADKNRTLIIGADVRVTTLRWPPGTRCMDAHRTEESPEARLARAQE